MQAIETYYIGPTDLRGSRIKAKCEAGSITLDWDDALGIEKNHDRAAKALCTKKGWSDPLYRGSLWNRGYVYVRAISFEKVDVN